MIRNGTNKCGNPQYHGKDGGVYRMLRPKERDSAQERAQILRTYRERIRLRGLQRGFGVWRRTVRRWLEPCTATLPPLAQTLGPAQAEEVLEIDEWVTFVSAKFFK